MSSQDTINPSSEQNGETLQQSVAGKDERMLVHEAFPPELETPVNLLLEHELTPVEVLFVRSNQKLDKSLSVEPISIEGWEIEITGLVDKPITFNATELEAMDQVDCEMVLQCSGNSRKIYSKRAEVEGTPWGCGAMGNIRFSGVPLRALLAAKGVNVLPEARFVTVDGRDKPLEGHENFEHSMPVDDVLDRSILALRMNDEPLPGVHGGPVRFITPGVYGTMQMKWVGSIRFDKEEVKNYNQMPRYRVPSTLIEPGEEFKNTFENSKFNWDLKVKSVVLSPSTETTLPVGDLTIAGVAFNDGKAPIESVLISFDEGQSWHQTELEHPKSLYAWTRFRIEVNVPAGKHSIWTRAIDALGRSQPLDGSIYWNPEGYEWNGVEKIEVTVE